jgi:hypothetical protein
MASELFEECINHRNLCPKPQPSNLPTRVIDVTNPDKPGLVITGGGREGSPLVYAALSYVWV